MLIPKRAQQPRKMCWKVVMRNARASGDLISKEGARAPAMYEPLTALDKNC